MQNYLNKLEYDKILTLLSANSKTYLGKELCLDLKPATSKDKVITLLKETDEACVLSLRKGNLPISDFEDISLPIKNLKSNISLSSKALLDTANILRLSRDLKEYFYKDEDFDLSNFSILDSYFCRLYSNKTIEDKIFSRDVEERDLDVDTKPAHKYEGEKISYHLDIDKERKFYAIDELIGKEIQSSKQSSVTIKDIKVDNKIYKC